MLYFVTSKCLAKFGEHLYQHMLFRCYSNNAQKLPLNALADVPSGARGLEFGLTSSIYSYFFFFVFPIGKLIA